MELWRADPGDVIRLPASYHPRTVTVTDTESAGTEHDRLWWETDDGTRGSTVLRRGIEVDLLHTERADKQAFLAPIGIAAEAAICSDCGATLTVASIGGKQYCRVDAGRRLAAGEPAEFDQDPADGEPPRLATDCRGSGVYDCPCEADGPDGLCSCCRTGECNGSCTSREMAAVKAGED